MVPMIKTFFKRLRCRLGFPFYWLRGPLVGAGFVPFDLPHGRCSLWLELTVEAIQGARMGVEKETRLFGGVFSGVDVALMLC